MEKVFEVVFTNFKMCLKKSRNLLHKYYLKIPGISGVIKKNTYIQQMTKSQYCIYVKNKVRKSNDRN